MSEKVKVYEDEFKTIYLEDDSYVVDSRYGSHIAKPVPNCEDFNLPNLYAVAIQDYTTDAMGGNESGIGIRFYFQATGTNITNVSDEQFYTNISEAGLSEIEIIDSVGYSGSHVYNGDMQAVDSISTMIGLLDKKFNKNRAIYTQYVKLDVKIAGSWVNLVDTTSNKWVENCLVSFKHKKNGSGKANEFDLTIIFKQNDRNIQNINELEAKLVSTCNIGESEGGLKALKDIYENCRFQYGYGDDLDLRSSEYVGSIIDYEVNLNAGQLVYNISGVSSIYLSKEIRLSTRDEYSPNSVSGPLQYIVNIFNVEFNNPDSELYGLFKLEFLNNCFDSNAHLIGVNADDYTQFKQKNLFEILEDILAGTVDNSDVENVEDLSPNQMKQFGYFVDDRKKTEECLGTVVIYKLPTFNTHFESNQINANIAFNWLGLGNSGINGIVKSWVPEYSGLMLRSLAATIKTTGNIYATMDADGNIVTVRGLGAIRLGTTVTSDGVFNTIQEYSKWSFITQYPYSATLTIMGLPCEIPITTQLNINVYMSSLNDKNAKHHSSGLYMVLGKEDSITSSGFYTTLKLFKITPSFNLITDKDVPIVTDEYLEETATDRLNNENNDYASRYEGSYSHMTIEDIQNEIVTQQDELAKLHESYENGDITNTTTYNFMVKEYEMYIEELYYALAQKQMEAE